MGILEEQGLAITNPTPSATVVNPDNNYVAETSLAQYNSTALQDVVQPLYESKAKQLEIAAQAKQKAIQGQQPLAQFNQPIDLSQYADTPTDNGSDSVGLLLGSSATNLLGSTADLAVDAGAYIARGANNLWEAAGGNEFYSKDEMNYALQATDFLGDTATNDKLWGYDRTAYQQGQEDVATAASEGRYLDAFTGSLSIAPELLAESIPTIASYFVGVGEVNSVKTAGVYAYKTALAKGMSKSTAKRLRQAAIKQATKQLSLTKNLVNSARVNAGFINSVNLQTRDNVEELTKNNVGIPPSATDIARMWATNFVLNGLDKWTAKDILGMHKSGAMKQVWGKLDRPSKLNTTKAIATATLNLAKNTGIEGAQEYAQQWGQIINEHWGTKDTKQLVQVLQDPELTNEALTAFFLGMGPGALMGAPHTVGKMGMDIHKGNKLRQKYEATTNNVDVGFATEEDKQVFDTKVNQDYEDTKTAFENLGVTEQSIQNIKNANTTTDFNKVSQIQELLSNSSQATDDPSTNLIREFGQEEIQGIIQLIQQNENLSPLLEQHVDSIIGNTPINTLRNLKQFLTANKDNLTSEIKQAFSSANKSLKEQASDLINSSATNVTFEAAKATLNRAGDLSKAALKRSEKNGGPRQAIGKTSGIVKGKSSKPDWLLNRVLGIGKPSDVEIELRKYDDETLEEVYKEAGKTISKTKKEQSAILNDPSVSKVVKARASMKKLPEQIQAEQVRKSIEIVRKQRKRVKNTYTEPKTWQESIKEFADDKFSKLKKAAEKVKADREARENATEADVQATDTNPKNRATKEDKAILKAANQMFDQVKDNIDSVAEEDIPLVQEAIDILVKTGNLGKPKADAVLQTIKNKYKQVNKENTEKVRKRLVKIGNNLTTKTKTATREDVKNDLSKLSNAINSKMTQSEREFVASMLGKAVALGSVSKKEATKLLNKLPQGMQFTKEDMTKEKFIDKTKKLFNKGLVTATKEGRQNLETKVSKKVQDVKNSDLGKELTKDFTSIMSKMFSAAKKGKTELSKQFREFKDKYKDVSSLEIYENVKETFSDLANGKTTEEVDNIPGVDTDCK